MIKIDLTKSGTSKFVCSSCGSTTTIINSVLDDDCDTIRCGTCHKTMVRSHQPKLQNGVQGAQKASHFNAGRMSKEVRRHKA